MSAEVTYLEAIRAALADALREDERVFLLGEDIGHFGGAFGVTKGLLEEFGEERVMDTPISEEGFVGAAIGAAWMGERPVVELQFADFVSVPVRCDRHGRREDALALRARDPARHPRAVRRRRARRPLPLARARRAGSSASRGSRSSAPARSRTRTACCARRSRTTIPSSTSSTRRSTDGCGTSCPTQPTARRSAVHASSAPATRRSSRTGPASR